MDEFKRIVCTNLDWVHQRIDAAARRSGRTADDVKLVAVTKYLAVEQTAVLPELGCISLGESRPQVLWEKAEAIGETNVEWHLIGHLQRNKVKRTLPIVSLIHSVDSLRLLGRINRFARELFEAGETARERVSILLEVNVSGDENKGGFAIEDMDQALEVSASCPHISLEGLMCMGGLASDEGQVRREFAQLREIRENYANADLSLPELSMGMSRDFEIAIEEGATLVRVGSVLYQPSGRD